MRIPFFAPYRAHRRWHRLKCEFEKTTKIQHLICVIYHLSCAIVCRRHDVRFLFYLIIVLSVYTLKRIRFNTNTLISCIQLLFVAAAPKRANKIWVFSSFSLFLFCEIEIASNLIYEMRSAIWKCAWSNTCLHVEKNKIKNSRYT